MIALRAGPAAGGLRPGCADVPSSPVVWVTRSEAHRPIELLDDQYAHEGVGQRERRQ